MANLDPYWLACVPVTQRAYLSLMDANPSTFPGDSHPVESVTWHEAILYCNRLSEVSGYQPCYRIKGEVVEWNPDSNGFRLPTDAEWEYACRAGSKEARYGLLEDIAWYEANTEGHPQDVGTKVPNAWGVYDMLGNVWEWCWDLYAPDVYGTYRVFRGGGWADAPRSCLAGNRRRSHPTFQIDDLGFRVARSV